MTEPKSTFTGISRQRAGDCAECIADLGSKQTHNSNDDNSNEGENNRVLNQTLTFFFWSEQHGSNSFPNNCLILRTFLRLSLFYLNKTDLQEKSYRFGLHSCYFVLTNMKFVIRNELEQRMKYAFPFRYCCQSQNFRRAFLLVHGST